ncbi:MAG: hypothetical protein OXN84_01690, partial [Albidovulum sp.]|nr:hypothetical protein [Albidovulum sp.]
SLGCGQLLALRAGEGIMTVRPYGTIAQSVNPRITACRAPQVYEETLFGRQASAEIAGNAVLELARKSRDLAPFVRDMGWADDDGHVLPPFLWDEERRMILRATHDALKFQLFGVTESDDACRIQRTCPIAEQHETATWGG